MNTFKPKTSWVVFTTEVGPKTCVARSKSKANVFEVLAYWAQCDPRIKLQRTVNKIVSEALVNQGRTPPAPLLKSENP